jgi:hypothetical protein
MDSSRSDLIAFVANNINNISIDYRNEILRIIMKNLDDDNVMQKGTGVQIYFSKISTELLIHLQNLINRWLVSSKEELMHQLL